MSATMSPLQLDTYFLKEISYSLKNNLDSIPEKKHEIEPVGLEIKDLTTPIEDVENGWRCELVITSADNDKDGNPYYNFKIVMVGFFKIDSTLPTDLAHKIAESNCPAVLYSTSREIIATVTRRSPYPAVLLPLVTFVNFNEPIEPAPKKTKTKKTK